MEVRVSAIELISTRRQELNQDVSIPAATHPIQKVVNLEDAPGKPTAFSHKRFASIG